MRFDPALKILALIESAKKLESSEIRFSSGASLSCEFNGGLAFLGYSIRNEYRDVSTVEAIEILEANYAR
jgi:hypothetical protein